MGVWGRTIEGYQDREGELESQVYMGGAERGEQREGVDERGDLAGQECLR